MQTITAGAIKPPRIPVIASIVTADGQKQLTWDATGRLVQATNSPTVAGDSGPTPTTVTYSYDGSGLRRTRTANGNVTGYLWVGGEMVEEQLPGNSLQYVSAGGVTISAGYSRLAHDGQGSVIAFAGGLSGTRRYDAFGQLLPGTTIGTGEPSLAYAGQYQDADLGLSYAQQRWYDATTGRFLSNDPVDVTAGRLVAPVGLDPWLYANENPLRFTDPDGLRAETDAEAAYLAKLEQALVARDRTFSHQRLGTQLASYLTGTGVAGDANVLRLNIQGMRAAIARAASGEQIRLGFIDAVGDSTRKIDIGGDSSLEFYKAPQYLTDSEAKRAAYVERKLQAGSAIGFSWLAASEYIAGEAQNADDATKDQMAIAGGALWAPFLAFADLEGQRIQNSRVPIPLAARAGPIVKISAPEGDGIRVIPRPSILQSIAEAARAPLETKADVNRTLTINEHESGWLSATGSVKPSPAQRAILRERGIIDVPVHGKDLCLGGACGRHGEQRGIAYGDQSNDPVVRQASSSGAGHGGKACPSCAAAQAARNIDNVTGVQ